MTPTPQAPPLRKRWQLRPAAPGRIASAAAQARLALDRSTAARCAVVAVVALLYTIAITWPHLPHLASSILGPGDNQGGIRGLWAFHAAGGDPFTSPRDLLVNAPEGVPSGRSINIGNFLWVAVVWILGNAFGFVAGFNLYGLAAFVLAAPAMYLLLDRLRFGVAAAAFGAFVFTFNPNHIEKLENSAPLAATGILPVVLLLFLRQRVLRRRRLACASGAAVAAAFYLDSYLGLFALWLAAIFVVTDLVTDRSPGVLGSYYWTAVTFVITMIPAAIGLALDPSSAQALAESRTTGLPGSSATIQLFLLPGPRNPWLGQPMHHWLDGHLAWEGTMFFGYTTIALAVAGFAIAFRLHRRGLLSAQERFLVLFVAVLLVTSIWAALPPTVDVVGVAVPTPQDGIRHATTLYRVFSRFGVLVGLSLVVMAAFALSRLGRGTQAVLVVCVATAVVAVELYVPRPASTTVVAWRTAVSVRQLAEAQSGRPHILDTTVVPQYVRELRRLPAGIVANYPDPAAPDARWAWKDEFLQTDHRHPLWDAQPGNPVDDSGLRAIASDLSRPDAAGILAGSGVRYVVVHASRYRSLGLRPPRPGCGLARVGGSSQVAVYRVVAAPASLFSTGGTLLSLYNPKLWPESAGYRWMGDSDRFAVYSDRDAQLDVHGNALSLDKPRTMTLSSPTDEAAPVTIGTSYTNFDFTIRVHPGKTVLVLRTDPGPELRGEGDPRKVSVAIGSIAVSSPDVPSAAPTCRGR